VRETPEQIGLRMAKVNKVSGSANANPVLVISFMVIIIVILASISIVAGA
jgi:hypothetical protein